MRKIGVHTSIAGGLHQALERAHELRCNTLQIFSHNPRGWAVRDKGTNEIAEFRRLKKNYSISPIFVHASYLINLASNNTDLIRKSIDMVVSEMRIADLIGAEYVVLHAGSASGNDPATARKRAVSCLTEISQRGNWQAGLLLENTAGESGDIGSKIAEVAEIINAVIGQLIAGICIDTCHAYSAGYDINSFESISFISSEIKRLIGRKRLRLFHLNDSKGALGSGTDRHEHIGKGKIGMKGMRNFLTFPDFINIPLILETPKKSENDDVRNLRVVRKLASEKTR
jgi:deoxyribonuclease-4